LKLHSPAWEQRFRRRARAAARTTPALWKEYKRSRQRWDGSVAWGVFFLFLLWIGFAAAMVYQPQLSVRLNASMALAATCFAFWRSNGLHNTLTSESLDCLLAHYPIPRPVAFQLVSREWLRDGWFVAALLAAVGAALGTTCSWGVALYTVAAQWLVLHVVAVCLTAIRQRLVLGWLGLGFLALAVLAWFRPGIAKGAEWFLPAGWALLACRGEWLAALPVLALVPVSIRCWQGARHNFVHATEAMLPVTVEEEATTGFSPAEPATTPAEIQDITDRLRTGVTLQALFDEPIDAPSRLLWRWLSPSEREAMRLVTGDEPLQLARQWRKSLMTLGIGVVIGWWLPATPASWVVGLALFVSVCFFGLDAATTCDELGCVWRTWILYPVGFWDIVRAAVKTLLVQLALWLPAPLLAGAVLALRWDAQPSWGLVCGAKTAVVGLILIPLLIVSRVSGETNDSTSPHCGGRLVLTALSSILLMLVMIAVFLIAPWPFALGGLVMAIALPWAFLGAYARWFNRSRFDLMPSTGPRSQSAM